MEIVPVGDTNRLFHITDVLPDTLFKDLLQVAWDTVPWRRISNQSHLSRRQLEPDHMPLFKDIAQCLRQRRVVIENELNIRFQRDHFNTVWWYDQPGFSIDIHTDGHLPSAMQLFWIASDQDQVTVFYQYKNMQYPISDFKFVPNTGYIMLNMPDADGTQPLLWHGMTVPVPADQFRISSYSLLGVYSQ